MGKWVSSRLLHSTLTNRTGGSRRLGVNRVSSRTSPGTTVFRVLLSTVKTTASWTSGANRAFSRTTTTTTAAVPIGTFHNLDQDKDLEMFKMSGALGASDDNLFSNVTISRGANEDWLN